MSFETKEQLRAKIAQSRRLQVQMTDQIDAESLKKFIEELEARLLLKMGSGPPKEGGLVYCSSFNPPL